MLSNITSARAELIIFFESSVNVGTGTLGVWRERNYSFVLREIILSLLLLLYSHLNAHEISGIYLEISIARTFSYREKRESFARCFEKSFLLHLLFYAAYTRIHLRVIGSSKRVLSASAST